MNWNFGFVSGPVVFSSNKPSNGDISAKVELLNGVKPAG